MSGEEGQSKNGYFPKRTRGFSLIELLVVVAIILLLSAITIPNLLRSRANASEASAVQSLRTLVNAQHLYSADYGNGFAPTLGTLSGTGAPTCDAANLVDPVLAGGIKSNYSFSYTGAGALGAGGPGCTTPGFTSFQLQADPASSIVTGQRHFYADESGVIRQNSKVAASVADPPIN